jgi:transketolase
MLYSMLHLTGYPDTTLEDLKQFRQLGSKTPGHPESFMTAGVEVCTGPLGQGLSNAVGMAMAEAHLAARFNKQGFPVVDNFTYVICGDGCLQEGVTSEASSLAGHLGLGKLIVLYDDNNITIDGSTDLSFTEDVGARYAAYGWHVQSVADGNSGSGDILAAVEAAKLVTDRPSMIKVKTIIGVGSKLENTHKVHGSPLGDEELARFKTHYGMNPEEFFAVPQAAGEFYGGCGAAGDTAQGEWAAMFGEYTKAFPEEAKSFERMTGGALPEGWMDALPRFTTESPTKASRIYSQMVLDSLTKAIPDLIGGSADLTPSNMTRVDEMAVDFQKATPHGRYLRFGVREHGMAAVCNGLAAYGGLIPYCATFLNFVGYALGAVRISALAGHRVIYVMTHDSIGLGEDGPTHQPVETLISLRAMPKMKVCRPADGNETSGSYALALTYAGPTTLSLSRQGLPNLEGTSIEAVAMGAYVLVESRGEKSLCSNIHSVAKYIHAALRHEMLHTET